MALARVPWALPPFGSLPCISHSISLFHFIFLFRINIHANCLGNNAPRSKYFPSSSHSLPLSKLDERQRPCHCTIFPNYLFIDFGDYLFQFFHRSLSIKALLSGALSSLYFLTLLVPECRWKEAPSSLNSRLFNREAFWNAYIPPRSWRHWSVPSSFSFFRFIPYLSFFKAKAGTRLLKCFNLDFHILKWYYLPRTPSLTLSSLSPYQHACNDHALHRPARPVTINGGMIMPAWYDIQTLSDEDRLSIECEGLDENKRQSTQPLVVVIPPNSSNLIIICSS